MSARKDVDVVLEDAVKRGAVPHVVAVAADEDGVIYEGAVGERAPGSGEPVTPDTLFYVASEVVTTVAALQQVERGNLDLDEPVEAFLPEFGDVRVLEGFDGDTPRLRQPASHATVRQLITHTSGLASGAWNAESRRWQHPHAPMITDPGTRFEYGSGADWLERVVEVASGLDLRAYYDAHILGPLGMSSTTSPGTAEQRRNLAPVHVRGEEGEWRATDVDADGLFSTPRDFLRFQRMLLGGGALEGVRILERSTVEQAFRNQIGDLEIATADRALGQGLKFGYGLLLTTRQEPDMRAPGSGAWAGLFNTPFWVDPASGITGAIYTQSLPFAEPSVYEVYREFEQALYASLARRPARFAREAARVGQEV